jgi:hypothetical protein
MRTTLTLEPDVAQQIKARMAAERVTLKEAVNQTLRAGLAAQRHQRTRQRFVVRPHNGGLMPGIDLDKISQVLDEMEVEELGRRLRK